MRVRPSLAWFLIAMLSGCESCFNHSCGDAGGGVDRNARGAGVAQSGKPDGTGLPATQSAARPDLTTLPIGAPCRIDLISAPGKGQAYEGTIVRVDKNEIVLSNVIYEGPMRRSRPPTVADLPGLGGPWFKDNTAIDWKKMPDQEVRIAKSEISAVRILDHDPTTEFYRR